MKNKISIDELVRQKVAHGEEPHNLGAWANMERMLDGKNPYQKEEDEKKRPWLFFLIGFLLCGTAVIGGYNYLSDYNDTSTNKLVNSPNQSMIEENIQPKTQNNIATQEATLLENNQDVDEQDVLLANNNSNPAQAVLLTTNTSKKKRLQGINENSFQQNRVALNKKSSLSEKRNVTNNIKENNPKANKDNKDEQSIDKLKLAKNEVSPTIIETYNDTIVVTEVSQRIEKDAMGNKNIINDSVQYNLVQQKKRTVINPRFVELTKEQEEAAQRKTAIASNDENFQAPAPRKIVKPIEAKAKTESGLVTNTNKTQKKSFYTLFKEFGKKVNQKAIEMAHTKYPIYSGMFVGVNAALVNSKHNFGGFQGGFTAMTPLSRLLTLQTEARFIHKNNSGYTITDNKHVIRNTFIDSSSLTHGLIYNYEIDSVSYGYNLQNFYTLQLPVLLNANFDKFNVYGGVHFNYGFRMDIATSQKSNAISIADTALLTSYIPRSNTQTKFNRDDFGSRLGLGYTLGAAYNINPNISLDLRMSNLFWDNTKGAAKKEISDVFFRIPSFQLSLGYRFRKFEKAP